MSESVNYLELLLLGNPISAWLIFFLIILLSFIVRKFISNRLISIILKILNKGDKDTSFNQQLNKPLNNIIFDSFSYFF